MRNTDKFNIQLDSSIYRKIQNKLKNYNIKIGGINITSYLVANTLIDDSADTLSVRTKRAVLHIAGDFDTHPEQLRASADLKTELLFNHTEYLALRRKLDILVKEYDKEHKISLEEGLDCRTVNDCIELVNSKMSKS